MSAIPFPSSRIRRINARQDLLAVADLIEICFARTLDSDGREYLRHLRWAAGDISYLSWLSAAAERMASPLNGYVWEEDGRIVGNLSLIPIHHDGTITYLIANVAVHPDYRQRGIGRQLTITALEHLRERGVASVWLQVRDDNPVAYHLYVSLGFTDQARRITWQSPLSPPGRWPDIGQVKISRRRVQDWNLQLDWLKRTYPPEVAWNLPLSFTRLSPSLWQQMNRWMRGEMQQQWGAFLGGNPIGFMAWEPMRSTTDALWIAAHLEYEDAAIQSLLLFARQALVRRGRLLSVNYPAGQAEEAFLQAGFSPHQVLVWMKAAL